jgi:predicted HicB family RNase H-like nuclease
MKVYFTSSITGLNKFRKNCEKVSQILRKNRHKVCEDFLKITKEQDRKETEKKSDFIYEYIIKKINEADIFIGEMSYRSTPVSYQLTYALEHKKPCLYLYEKDNGNPVHAVFKGNPSKYLTIIEYEAVDLEDIIDGFIKKSKKLMMRRFNFLIPAELDDKLRIKAAIEGVSKGEYLRKIIEDKIDK